MVENTLETLSLQKAIHGKMEKMYVNGDLLLKIPFLSICHLLQSKVKGDLSPCFKGNAQFSKQRLMQADATPRHEMLTLSLNENTNPFLKQTKALP